MSSGYAYKRPRRLNLMTVVIVAAIAIGVYLAAKFGPPYWQRYKVDEILTDVAFQAIDLRLTTPDSRYDQEQKLVDRARERIIALGIDADALEVGFESDMSAVHADYTVVVNVIALGPKVLEFHRSIGVPGDDKAP